MRRPPVQRDMEALGSLVLEIGRLEVSRSRSATSLGMIARYLGANEPAIAGLAMV